MAVKVKNKSWFCFSLFDRTSIDYFRNLINMAIPTISNQILPSVSAMTVTYLIAQLGTTSVAFWTLLSRIEMFALVFSLSLTMSVPPLVGRYIGENKIEKVTQLVFSSAAIVVIYHLIIAVILAISAPYIANLLTTDTRLSDSLSYALIFVPLSYGPLGLCMLIVSVFNALCEPRKALVLSSLRLFVFYIPATFIGVSIGGIENVLWAVFVANILAGSTAWFMFYQRTNQFKKTVEYCVTS